MLKPWVVDLLLWTHRSVDHLQLSVGLNFS